jgi:hypothetical protein
MIRIVSIIQISQVTNNFICYTRTASLYWLHKQAFFGSSEGPSLERSKFSLYFPGSCIPTNESVFTSLTLYILTLAQTVQDYIGYNVLSLWAYDLITDMYILLYE